MSDKTGIEWTRGDDGTAGATQALSAASGAPAPAEVGELAALLYDFAPGDMLGRTAIATLILRRYRLEARDDPRD